MKMFLVSGVPMSVQQDGWWMSAEAPKGPNSPSVDTAGKPDPSSVRLGLLAALVALADLLIWQVAPGISLVVFFLVVLGVALFLLGKSLTPGRTGLALLVGSVALLPLIEQVQALSVLIAMVGMSVAAVIAAVGSKGLMAGAMRFWQALPLRGLRDAIGGTRSLARSEYVMPTAQRLALRWALPLGFGLAFLGLLAEANPMLEAWVNDVTDFTLHGPGLGRVLFWLGMAILIWPLLVLGKLKQQLILPFSQRHIGTGPLVNADAVARSLILFNALFAVQTLMDITYLWGGAVLPDGMTYAEYAHRGAYPLVATALLAGVFALLSRPFTTGSRALRVALLLFIAQNVFLVCSSLFRLDLYVDTYGLTRLRLAAYIWMALVGVGLCMITWQVIAHRGNGWLMRRLVLVGAATIYGATLYSFDAAIVRHNLTHNVPLDRYYLCNLGPAALPAIRSFEAQIGEPLCTVYQAPQTPEFADWREWGFRDWRVLRSLADMQPEPNLP